MLRHTPLVVQARPVELLLVHGCRRRNLQCLQTCDAENNLQWHGGSLDSQAMASYGHAPIGSPENAICSDMDIVVGSPGRIKQRSPSCSRSGGFQSPVLSYLLILSWLTASSVAVLMNLGDISHLEARTLRLGQELKREKLAFNGGQCIYDLVDLKEGHWYEVKISYPASTPASFSVDLLSELSEGSVLSRRKLLNTEKIIFHVNNEQTLQDIQGFTKCRVLVTVKPAGVVAKPLVQEQPFIIFNIVAEEVVFGVPLQAFWVGILGLIAILASVIASRQLVPLLCPPRQLVTIKTSKEIL